MLGPLGLLRLVEDDEEEADEAFDLVRFLPDSADVAIAGCVVPCFSSVGVGCISGWWLGPKGLFFGDIFRFQISYARCARCGERAL